MTDTFAPPGGAPAPSETMVEPRLRARRIEVRRAQRRRRRRWLIGSAMLVVLAVLAVGSLYSPLFDVDHLDVEGVRHLDPDAVVAAAGLAAGQRMVDLDTPTAEARLGELPWVSDVRVVRRWPATVEIRITEREAVAVLVEPDGRRLVMAADGTVPGEAGDLDAELPTVALAPEVEARAVVGAPMVEPFGAAVRMVGALPATVAERAREIVVDAEGRVTVTMAYGARLQLGRAEEVADKFLKAEAILGGGVVLDCLELVDVSVPSAPVVRRAASCR